MTKSEIIYELKERIKDQKDEYEFWRKKHAELPTEEERRLNVENLKQLARKKVERGELFAYNELKEYDEKIKNETSQTYYNMFLALVREDILSRFLATIDDKGGCD